MNLPPDIVLKVVRPLYGIPDSVLHWYITYFLFHQELLEMRRARMDPCFLMRHNVDGSLDGVIVLQVDKSLGIGTPKSPKG